MERQRLQEGIEALRGAQVRREHHTILGHIVEIEKRMVRLDEESRQEFAVLRENIANLSQQLKEIEENSVTQKEWQWHKDRELARTERDKFVATGAFGEHEKMMAERQIATRAEYQHSGGVVSHLPELSRVVLEPIPSPEPYKSPFVEQSPFYQLASNVSHDSPSTAELMAMMPEESVGPSDDDDDDDDLDAFRLKSNAGSSWGAPLNTATGDTPPRPSGEIGIDHKNNKGVRAKSKTTESATPRSIDGQPSKVIRLNANPREDQRQSKAGDNSNTKKRPHEGVSNVSLRVAEHIAEQERKKASVVHPAKRVRVAPSEHVYGHRPATRSSNREDPIEPPLSPITPLFKDPKSKPGSKLVSKLGFNPAAPGLSSMPIPNPMPKQISRPASSSAAPKPPSLSVSKSMPKLPRLVQGKRTLAKYYMDSNNAFSTFENKGPDGQCEFVNHFLAGIHLKKNRDMAIEELQQAQESTIKNGKPWIVCKWADVLNSLRVAKLVRKSEVT